MGKSVTIYDIAREAGCSTATVSRVLAGSSGVSPALRGKVLTLIEKYHYHPNAAAQRLETGKSRTFGIIMPPVTNPYYASLFSAANETAKELGYVTWLHPLPPDYYVIDETLVRYLVRQRPAGIMLAGGFAREGNQTIHNAVQLLRNYMPVVTVSAPSPDLGCLCCHNNVKAAVENAVLHLHRLGHTRIAFLGGPPGPLEGHARGRAYLRALARCGIAPPPYDAHSGYDADAGAQALIRMLMPLSRSEYPTAFVCFNDLIAIGAIRLLRKAGLCVPNDVAIVGCDNSFFAPFVDPPLTTIDMFPTETARWAVRALLCNGGSETQAGVKVVDAKLIVRVSCGAELGRRTFPE